LRFYEPGGLPGIFPVAERGCPILDAYSYGVVADFHRSSRTPSDGYLYKRIKEPRQLFHPEKNVMQTPQGKLSGALAPDFAKRHERSPQVILHRGAIKPLFKVVS
jgi:hypothetical protein